MSSCRYCLDDRINEAGLCPRHAKDRALRVYPRDAELAALRVEAEHLRQAVTTLSRMHDDAKAEVERLRSAGAPPTKVVHAIDLLFGLLPTHLHRHERDAKSLVCKWINDTLLTMPAKGHSDV